MGLRGPAGKSRDQREAEGNTSHRPAPEARPQFVPGAPERPKGMTAAARRAWDDYVERMAPLGFLRKVDVFALRRLCEDVAELNELQVGRRRLLTTMRREAKAAGKTLRGGPEVVLATSQEGRRLALAIGQVSGRVYRMELQFGLTPVAGTRLQETGGVVSFPEAGGAGPTPVTIEQALCG